MSRSAIPDHLQTERTVPAKIAEGYEPLFPGFASRFPEKAAGLVIGIIGAQFPSQSQVDDAVVPKLESFASAAGGVSYSEWASGTDAKGFYNLTMLAYWPSKEVYESWSVESGFKQWWEGIDANETKNGWFLEVLSPSVDRLETIFSHKDAREGVAYLEEAQVGPIREHIYWGSMRDRLPASQTDELQGEKKEQTSSTNGNNSNGEEKPRTRVQVHGKKNLAVIRSGQDLSTALPEERKLYEDDLAPVLEKGMSFLRDEGESIGCHSCRFMDVIDGKTREANKDRTFGLAYFDDLASLEYWSKEHPTHIAIFGGFMQYAHKLQGNISLRLFHEVLVLKPEQQFFEYIACHPRTGMLGA
jgi:hypothetical protein